MSEPTLTFLYNTTTNDTAYSGTGAADSNFNVIDTNNNTLIFTGGGILGELSNPSASGTRDATLRPPVSSYIIPQVFIEDNLWMTQALLAGYGPSASQGPYRYVFAAYVDGTMNSDLYLEAYDDNTFSSTASEVFVGSANSGNESYINAIRTTDSAPPWAPGWNGSDTGANYIKGASDRVALANASTITDQAVYFNMYIRLETDSSTFHNTPVFAFRYLYT